MIEEEISIFMMDDKLKSVVAEALWDIDTVSDALVEEDGFVINFFED